MVIISKGSGLNDDMWKDTGTAVTSWIMDVDKEQTNDDEQVKAIFKVEKSNKFAEKSSGITSMGDFLPANEGDNAPLDTIMEGFPKMIEHTPYLKKLVITKEMNDDNRVAEMKNQVRGFMHAYKRTRAKFATNCLVGATTGTTFVYGGKTFDCSTGDGKALFATDHPGKKSGVAVQSNKFTNALGTDATMLYTLANIGRNFRNDSGEKCGYEFNTVYLPANRPQMEELVGRIIGSNQVVGSANNDINTQKGKWKMKVLTYWDAEAGENPYIIGSSEMQDDFAPSVFYDRIPLTMRDSINNDNFNLEFSAYCRFSAGFRDWRHLILGGASSGSTLS